MLELLARSEDAPLADILSLRSHVGAVRLGIEQLTAQREQLDRLVALATVLVIIRAEDAPTEEPETEGLGSYFGDQLTSAWESGLLFVADTMGLLVRVLVGGVVWWVLLVLVAIALSRYRRRRLAEGM